MRFCLLLIVSCEVVQYVHITDTIIYSLELICSTGTLSTFHHIHLHSFSSFFAPFLWGTRNSLEMWDLRFFFSLEGWYVDIKRAELKFLDEKLNPPRDATTSAGSKPSDAEISQAWRELYMEFGWKWKILWREAANQRKLLLIDNLKKATTKDWCDVNWSELTCFGLFFLAAPKIAPAKEAGVNISEHWRKLISYRSYLLMDQTCKQLQWLCAAVALHCRKVLLYSQPAIIYLLQYIYQTRRSAWSESKIYNLLIKHIFDIYNI